MIGLKSSGRRWCEIPLPGILPVIGDSTDLDCPRLWFTARQIHVLNKSFWRSLKMITPYNISGTRLWLCFEQESLAMTSTRCVTCLWLLTFLWWKSKILGIIYDSKKGTAMEMCFLMVIEQHYDDSELSSH